MSDRCATTRVEREKMYGSQRMESKWAASSIPFLLSSIFFFLCLLCCLTAALDSQNFFIPCWKTQIDHFYVWVFWSPGVTPPPRPSHHHHSSRHYFIDLNIGFGECLETAPHILPLPCPYFFFCSTLYKMDWCWISLDPKPSSIFIRETQNPDHKIKCYRHIYVEPKAVLWFGINHRFKNKQTKNTRLLLPLYLFVLHRVPNFFLHKANKWLLLTRVSQR